MLGQHKQGHYSPRFPSLLISFALNMCIARSPVLHTFFSAIGIWWLSMKISIATILQHISEKILIHSLQCDKLLIASNFQLKHMVFRQSIQISVICSFFAISESDTLFLKLLHCLSLLDK